MYIQLARHSVILQWIHQRLFKRVKPRYEKRLLGRSGDLKTFRVLRACRSVTVLFRRGLFSRVLFFQRPENFSVKSYNAVAACSDIILSQILNFRNLPYSYFEIIFASPRELRSVCLILMYRRTFIRTNYCQNICRKHKIFFKPNRVQTLSHPFLMFDLKIKYHRFCVQGEIRDRRLFPRKTNNLMEAVAHGLLLATCQESVPKTDVLARAQKRTYRNLYRRIRIQCYPAKYEG